MSLKRAANKFVILELISMWFRIFLANIAAFANSHLITDLITDECNEALNVILEKVMVQPNHMSI